MDVQQPVISNPGNLSITLEYTGSQLGYYYTYDLERNIEEQKLMIVRGISKDNCAFPFRKYNCGHSYNAGEAVIHIYIL